MPEVSVALLPGDGIGPEVVAEARRVVDAIAPDHGLSIGWHEHLVGGASIDAHGTALTDDVLEACAGSDAVLLGAVGGPNWDTTDPDEPRPEQGLLGLRSGLGLFANLRPVRPWPALYEASPLRRERIEGTDLLVVRELTGGLYFGERGREPDRAFDTCVYTREEVRRLAEWGFRAAAGRRGRVTSVDKANVLETSRLWREEVVRVAEGHPGVALEHMLVDNAAMQLVSRPADFDVIITENLFGDVLSDEAAMITGSIGMLPSASLAAGSLGLYEPVHGSAPDIAGRGVANPVATVLSAAMMLRYSLGAPEAADRLEGAVDAVLGAGHRTPDLGGALGTREVGDLILAQLAG
ncbi:3-isopropylmalate dehydrogenase [Miltoncostaea marina]|uniref:3-isopropylmalate dehydrogenase n=1 Tax=Miltoncostaea marina TaxID=2843215 RepID=UPI001C3DAC42|nr:3-isopropylmalate dehydrogenase [Miltoncostaea marina]